MAMYVLLAALVVLLIFTYHKAQKDIMDPAVIFCAMYIVSVFCALLNIQKWNIHMRWYTVAFLVIGAVIFVGVSIGTKKFVLSTASKSTLKQNQPSEKNKEIPVAVVLFSCAYSILTIWLMVSEILKIARMFGEFTTFSQALTIYKDHASYKMEVQLPKYVTLMLKPVIACAYIMTFFFFKGILKENLSWKKKFVRYWYYLLPAIFYIVQRLLESNRGAIIDFVIAMLVMYFVLWNRKNNWKKSVKVRVLVEVGAIGVIGLIIFYYSASIIGRINTKGLFDYITYYCGGSIECFNRYLQNMPEHSKIFGEETFYHLIVDLDSLGITNFDLQSLVSGHFDFQYYNDIMIGNIYTAYRRWMQDFGIVGTILLQSVMAAFFSGFYYKIKIMAQSGKRTDFAIILYAYLAYCIFLHSIDAYFYLETFSKATVATLVVLFAVYSLIQYGPQWIQKKWRKKV